MVPDYFVTADGASIMTALATRLLQLTITDKAGVSSDALDILLSDEADEIDPPRKGAKLKVWIGYRPDGAALFLASTGLVYMASSPSTRWRCLSGRAICASRPRAPTSGSRCPAAR